MQKNLWLILYMILILSTSLFSWGPRSHVQVAEIAGMLLTDDALPTSAAFYVAYQDEIISGSVFADWAYQNFWTSNSLSDHAHEMAFGDTYYDYVTSTFDLSDPSNHPEFAFCLGVLSHIYADRIFYGDNGEYGLGLAGTDNDGVGMGDLETNLDRIVGHDYTAPDFDWYWPTGTIIEVYDIYGDDVSSAGLWAGIEALEILYDARTSIDSFAYLNAVDAIPWTNDNYGNYYPGGLMNAGALSAVKMRNAWAKAINNWQILQQTQTGCGYMDNTDAHLLPFAPRTNTGGENRYIATWDSEYENGATVIKFDMSDIDTSGYFLESAEFYLYYKRPHTSVPSGDKRLALYKLNRLWNEGDKEDGEYNEYLGEPLLDGENYVCYDEARYGISEWTVPGADGVPTDREEFHLDYQDFGPATSYPFWYHWTITNAARSWIRNPAHNYGMVLKEEDNTYDGMVEFIASESQLVNYHPLVVVTLTSTSTDIDETHEIPEGLSIKAYPNPFNSAITISGKGITHIEIYDIEGKLIDKFGKCDIANKHDITNQKWIPGESVISGVYFIKTGNNEELHRVVYIK
ncbi:MAG: T9SS type A sorting domain-containing protein [Candidatus Zixiibacteriota bacterium]